jgi:hypothetical protein
MKRPPTSRMALVALPAGTTGTMEANMPQSIYREPAAPSATARTLAKGWGVWPSPDDFDGHHGSRGRELYLL